jgi:hypothetical protein
VYSEGVGSVMMEPADRLLRPVLLSRVLYVPALQNNLLSVLHLVANHRFRIEIEGKEMVFLQNGKQRFTAVMRDNTAIKGKVATGFVVKSDAPAPSHCEPCICGKHHCDPFPKRASHRATSFLERIHSDLHQLPVLTSTGFCHWLLFIDDYLRYFWIYLLQKKSDTFDAFKEFKAMVEKQFDKAILCLHNDKGSEFIGIK